MIVAPVATREVGRFEFAASGQSEKRRLHGNTSSPSRADPRGSCMTAKHNVGPIAESALLLRRLIPHACWSSAKMLDSASDFAESTNFAFAVAFTLANCVPLHTRTGPIVRHANISLIPAPAPGINERTLPDDAPSPAPHSGSELHRGNGVDGGGVRQSHAVVVPDAGAEDFEDPRSRRGAGHLHFAPKTVARQQPQDLGFVQRGYQRDCRPASWR